VTECTPAYRASVRDFIEINVARSIAKERIERGMIEALERYEESDGDIDLSMGASGACSV
jgi:DNA-directed RNA polymerase III subunit RPC1